MNLDTDERKLQALKAVHKLIDSLPDGWHGEPSCYPDVVFLAHEDRPGAAAAVNVLDGRAKVRDGLDGIDAMLAKRGIAIENQEVQP